MHDALCVLSQTVKETRTVYGGGCSESIMAQAVDELAVRTPGKESMAIESFARALRQVQLYFQNNKLNNFIKLILVLAKSIVKMKKFALDFERTSFHCIPTYQLIMFICIKKVFSNI